MDADLTLLKELTEVNGPSGFESRVHALMKDRIIQHTSEIVTDNLGSIVGKHGEKGPKILIAGHMDEVGLMVKRITKDGFLQMQTLGGWWSHVMLAQRVKVLTQRGDITGVIGSKAPHVLSIEERRNVLSIDRMFIDIGATTKEEAGKMGVEVGDPITPICPFEVLSNPKMTLGKAFDDRAGCYMALKALERISETDHPNIVYAGATVQEEVGLRGAETLINAIQPDVAFALDVGIAGDTPGMDPKDGDNRLGGGPVLGFYDGSMIPHLQLRDFVVRSAKEAGIPYQIEIMPGGGTDAGAFHTSFRGIPTMVIGVPARYIHSHVSIVHRDDLENGVRLIVELLKKLSQETVEELKGMNGSVKRQGADQTKGLVTV